MQSTLSNYSIDGHDLTLRLSPEAFQPTTTTQKIAELATIPVGSAVLDLGCGVGPLAVVAALKGAARVCAVDIVPAAVECARENAQRAGVADKVTVFCGDLFAPVKGMKFDVIVNDVSGIADRVARISPWYPETIPTGGEDGTDVVLRVLSEFPQYLNPGGSLYYATSTLSDTAKINAHARKLYGDKVELLGSYRFPFGPELAEAIDELNQLQAQGKISFETRKSRHLWTLDIFRITP
jgi:release factor glutamine methyltransferase